MNRRTLGSVAATFAMLGLGGCYGGLSSHQDSLGGQADSSDAPPGESDGSSSEETGAASQCAEVSRIPQAIRGLNGRQYARTIEAVFPSVGSVDELFRDSDRSAEFSTSSQIRRLDFKTTADVVAAAKAVSTEAVDSVVERFSCLEASPADPSCVRSVVEELSFELYRGPAPAEHQDALVGLFESARDASDTTRAVQTLVQAMLTSPRFLFRQEIGEPTEDGAGSVLNSYEVASALSYSLTDAPPDAELRDAASRDQLSTPEQIEAQARRLLVERGDDQTGMIAFVRELTGVRDFALVQKDQNDFPEFDEATQQAVLADFEATVGALLGSDEPTLERLLNGREFVVSAASARLLGWDEPDQYDANAGLVEVDEQGRRGVLTHPAMLGTYAHESETNPVARGHFVSGKLLCVDTPPPPPDVAFPELDDTEETLRQTLERTHSVDSCASCHSLMDPYGWPFEVFDSVGRRRDTDRGFPIDDSSTIVVADEFEGPVNDVSEMLDIISASTIAHQCVGERVFKYVAGVGNELDGYACITEELSAPFVEDGDIPGQFIRLLASPWFLERAAEP